MSSRPRAYRAKHDPEAAMRSPLPEFEAAIESDGGLDRASIAKLAETVRLPIATVRGALSSFSDTRTDPRAVRVCTGLSCVLAGGSEMWRDLAGRHSCRPVYCLGYCDRSPAVMRGDGCVVPDLPHQCNGARADAAAADTLLRGIAPPHPAPPSIRCAARHAVITRRIGVPEHVGPSVPEYAGLRAARATDPAAVAQKIVDSGLRGRGGAAYPTGKKWQLAAAASGSPKFIVANGDEGDPGSFIDRELMERDPHAILEGMAIAAHAVGAQRGVIFIRSEYPVAARVMAAAIGDAVKRGHLGADALGAGRPFDVEVVRGLGSYVCGEETAMLAAIEGRRGEVAPRPPYPVESGLFGKPTVVDNVETLANVAWIAAHGAGAFAAMGTTESKGTKAICFNRGFARPGIVEVEFGITMRSAIEELAGGGFGGVELEAVLLGGPMGSIVTPDRWDVPICFAAMSRQAINLGHGGMVAIPVGTDWNALLRHLVAFMRHESCGKCVPCSLGSKRAHELATSGLGPPTLPEFNRIMALMKDASLCAFGRETPGPIRTILETFADRLTKETPR